MINDSIYAHIESNNYAGLRRATYKSHIKDAKSYLLSNHKKADTVTIEKWQNTSSIYQLTILQYIKTIKNTYL